MTRLECLRALVALDGEIGQIGAELAGFPWDAEELVFLEWADVIAVLTRFLRRQVSAEAVEEWANTIECRDDVSYDGPLGEVIFELANPELSTRLSSERAEAIVAEWAEQRGRTRSERPS